MGKPVSWRQITVLVSEKCWTNFSRHLRKQQIFSILFGQTLLKHLYILLEWESYGIENEVFTKQARFYSSCSQEVEKK